MKRAKYTLAEIIEDIWPQITKDNRYNTYHLRHLYAIKSCRTSALGGHLYQCSKCSSYHKRYHSCRNRHCPSCQKRQAKQWIEAREKELIATTYYHVVFTLPSSLHELCISYPRQMYKMLFEASWHTLETLGWDQKFLGAQLGAVMTLHTWGQTLSLHPHLHCIVPGGGVDYKRQWRSVRGKGKFLFPVRVMSRIFRGKYISLLKKFLNDEGMVYCSALHNSLYQKDWVVYCKQPFVGSKGVVEYLARYTYKTAISNHRISGKDIHCVEIRYKDYRHGGKVKYMRLAKTEFIRRFSLHILPKGFTRIRHYGILSGRLKHELLDIPKPLKQEDSWEAYWLSKGLDVRLCPICKTGKLIHIKELPKRGPPKNQTTNKTNM